MICLFGVSINIYRAVLRIAQAVSALTLINLVTMGLKVFNYVTADVRFRTLLAVYLKKMGVN